MKKLIFIAIALITLANASATRTVTIDGLRYLINTDELTATLMANGSHYSGDISISQSVSINDSTFLVVALAGNSFEGCYGLVSVSIPNTVKTIGNSCFSGCRKLKTVKMSTSVISLGDNCFSMCDSLSSIELPASLRTLGDGCFSACISLTTINLPNGITTLPGSCFDECWNLKEIVIPSSVTSIGDYCFYICRSLESVSIPSSVTTLGGYCFSACGALKSVSIPPSVKSIGYDCFSDCWSLTTLSIPSSVDSIGHNCFQNCTNLETIFCYSTTPPIIYNGSTLGQSGSTILYVPSSSIELYKKADGWKDFVAILGISGSTELEKCGSPIVTYADKKLHFASSTPSAEFHYSIKCNDVIDNAFSSNGDVELSASYDLSVYATAENYSPSDATEATLYWVEGTLDSPTGIQSAKHRGILSTISNGVVTLSGLNDNEVVDFYSVDGSKLSSKKAIDGRVSYSAINEKILLVKIGSDVLKLLVR